MIYQKNIIFNVGAWWWNRCIKVQLHWGIWCNKVLSIKQLQF